MQLGRRRGENTAGQGSFSCLELEHPHGSYQRPAPDPKVQMIKRAAGGKRCTSVVEEAEAHKIVAGDEELGARGVRRYPHNAAAAVQRRRHINVALTIERETLWAAQPTEENARIPVRC